MNRDFEYGRGPAAPLSAYGQRRRVNGSSSSSASSSYSDLSEYSEPNMPPPNMNGYVFVKALYTKELNENLA